MRPRRTRKCSRRSSARRRPLHPSGGASSRRMRRTRMRICRRTERGGESRGRPRLRQRRVVDCMRTTRTTTRMRTCRRTASSGALHCTALRVEGQVVLSAFASCDVGRPRAVCCARLVRWDGALAAHTSRASTVVDALRAAPWPTRRALDRRRRRGSRAAARRPRADARCRPTAPTLRLAWPGGSSTTRRPTQRPSRETRRPSSASRARASTRCRIRDPSRARLRSPRLSRALARIGIGRQSTASRHGRCVRR